MSSQKKSTVLIIGGGYAGLALARELDSNPRIELKVVDAREGFMLHKFAALRASVAGEEWLDKVLVPTHQTLRNGKVIRGKVVKVNDMDKTAILETGESIKFDVVVIATGARNLSPGEPPLSVKDVAGTKQYFSEMGSAIEKAKKIVVYGSGLVGIELCGEILSKYPEKSVCLVNGKNHKLAGKNKLTPSQVKSVTKMLESGKMRYVNNDDVIYPVLPTDNFADASPLVTVPEGKVKLASGRSVDGDLVIMCFGGRLSTFGVFPNGWLSIQTGELKIDQDTFQVKNCEFAFAFGDVADTAHDKLGVEHMSDSKIVAANILYLVNGKKATKKASNAKKGFIISFGTSQGKTFIPGLPSFGNFVSRSIKSKDLFVATVWKQYAGGLKPLTHKWTQLETMLQDHALDEKKEDGGKVEKVVE